MLLNPSIFDPQQLSYEEISSLKAEPGNIAMIDNIVFPEVLVKQLRLQLVKEDGELYRHSKKWYSEMDDSQKCCLGGWITSSHGVNGLAFLIDKSMYQKTPEGKKGFIRIFDPVVLQHLIVSLTDAQLGALFYFIDRWEFYDLNGNIFSLEIHDRTLKEVGFTQAQWNSLERLDIIRHVVNVWSELIVEPLPFDATMQAYYHIDKAIFYGLESQLDITVYSLIGLMYNNCFDNNPLFKEKIQRCIKGKRFAENLNIYNQSGYFSNLGN